MKGLRLKFFVIVFAVLLVATIGSLAYAGETDLALRRIARKAASGVDANLAKSLVVGDEGYLVPCIMKSRDPAATIDAIVKVGGRAVRIGSGQIVSAHIPVESINAIVTRDEVVFTEAANLLSGKMDTARYATNVVALQDGSALDVAYKGTDVIVGAVDNTFDYGNADFTDASGVSRVQYVQQTVSGEKVECAHQAIVSDTCDITDGGQGYTHGTHVMGIAGGSDATYTGVAPDADLMFVFNSATDADTGGSLATAVVEGVSDIFAQADALDKPAVVNLSLGTSIGAHDGTSLLEQGLDELVGSNPGRIVVNAAGNEQVIDAAYTGSASAGYVGGIHAGISVPAGASHGFRIAIWSGSGAGSLVDLWLTSGDKDNCSVAAFAYTEGRSPLDYTFPGLATTDNATFATADVPFATDTSSPVSTNDGSVKVNIEIDAEDARNGKPHAEVTFTSIGAGFGGDLDTRWYDVVIRAGAAACTGNMWLYYDAVLVHDFLTGIEGAGFDVGDGATYTGYTLMDGDSLLTMTIPSTANKVIAVGSFMPPKPVGETVSQWTGNNGTTYSQSDYNLSVGALGSTTGDLSSFSSLGPTADGRTKPAIVTPGEPIISTKATEAFVSSSESVGENHMKMQGTSMASPHAAGIVALLLERNNTLTVDQVRTALQAGADTSGMTAKTPDPANSYGAGKVNAVSVLSSVSVDHSAYSGGGDSGGGSSRCSFVSHGTSVVPLAVLAILSLAAMPAFRSRRRKKGNR